MHQVRVLVVDDEQDIAEMIAEILAPSGYWVETADNGRAALEALAARSFDVLISDLLMPTLDGPGLFRELRRSHPEMIGKVIFITGDTLSETAQSFLDTAGRPVIEKPFVPEEIRSVVAKVLEGSG